VADGDESLLDVFVNIRPDPNFQDIIRTSANEAIAEYARIFSSASIPSPRLGPPNVSGGGTGGGGGGNAGGGGTGGGGRGTLAQEYRDAARALEDLQRNLRTVSRESSLSGIVQFDDEVKRLQDQLSDLVLNVRRQTQDRDLLGIQASLQYVEPLRQEILRVFQDVSNQRPLKEQFDYAVSGGREAISTGRITNRLEESMIRGLPSGEMRQNIARLRAELELAEFQVRSLSQSFDGTQDSVDRVVASVRGLSEAQESLRATYREAQVASVSMNTLSNNAYQLGQAFEDFAVGFSLNGIAGGIRGSANNVAFLLNSLSQSKVFTEALAKQFIAMKGNVPAAEAAKMAEKFSTALPLVAGIGSALAITVVPSMLEWLATLDDVELKLIEIQDRIKQTARDSDFASGLRASNDQLLETLREAGSVRDVLEEIKRIQFESSQGNKKVSESFGALTQSGDIRDTLTNLNTLSNKTDEYIAKLETAAAAVDPENAARIPGPRPPREFQEEVFEARKRELQTVKELRENIRIAREDLLKANIEVSSGSDKQAEAIEKANNSYKKLSETIKELEKAEAFGDAKDLEKAKEQVEAFRVELEKISDLSAEINNRTQNQLPAALQAVVTQSEKLAFSLEVAKANAIGIVDEEAVMLEKMQASNDEFRERLNLQLAIARESGASPEAINAANRAATMSQYRMQEVEILNEIKKREEEIEKIEDRRSGKAKFTNFEQYAKDLQVNVSSIEKDNKDVIKENTEEIRKLKELLFILRQNRNENMQDLPSDPDKLLKTLEDRREDFNQEMRNIILPIEARLLLKLDDLKDGFQDMTGIGFDLPKQDSSMLDRVIGDIMSRRLPTNKADIAATILDVGYNAIKGEIAGAIKDAMKTASDAIIRSQDMTTNAVEKKKMGAIAQ
jgi:predicted transcriptional regulator